MIEVSYIDSTTNLNWTVGLDWSFDTHAVPSWGEDFVMWGGSKLTSINATWPHGNWSEDVAMNGGKQVATMIEVSDDAPWLVLHELGHSIGLAHNPGDPTSVMNNTVTPNASTWDAADLRALHELGAR